ncbi:hypothetical protein EW146_g9181 [Bondarzewia mesenterica]|uniref:DUF829 domain-containing protein n=1 Tax=Bondarzewia mesenterica TaxID=1095465 RepID=A0A4S4L8L7_9AGAM|nr:hypothetical protein EW146_g9181 [Bondarzewia mesenterica]
MSCSLIRETRRHLMPCIHLDARLPHLQKYVDGLGSAYPSSTIVLIRSSSSFYRTCQRQLESTVEPVVDIIRKEKSRGSQFRGILVHVLSNGGGFQLVILRKILAKSTASDNADTSAAPTALILDSTPGDNGLASAISSMAPKNRALRLLAISIISLLYAVFSVINNVAGNPPIFKELRDILNSPNLLPSITNSKDPKATPRLYIYSESDRMTVAPKVAAHIEDAVSKGFDVTVEKFTNSAHVAHARSDPERYWGAVHRLWIKAASSAGVSTSVST